MRFNGIPPSSQRMAILPHLTTSLSHSSVANTASSSLHGLLAGTRSSCQPLFFFSSILRRLQTWFEKASASGGLTPAFAGAAAAGIPPSHMEAQKDIPSMGAVFMSGWRSGDTIEGHLCRQEHIPRVLSERYDFYDSSTYPHGRIKTLAYALWNRARGWDAESLFWILDDRHCTEMQRLQKLEAMAQRIL